MMRHLVPAALLLAGCASQSPSQSVSQNIGLLISERRFEEAVQQAAANARAKPDDPDADEVYRLATAALLMDQGRTAFYDGELHTAAGFFDEAYEVAPEAPQTSQWKRKIHDEIADAKLNEAIRLHALEELEGAVVAYEEVIANRPDDLRAQEGLGRALLQINYRQGMGAEYYNDGVRNLNEYYLHEARAKFGYTGLYWGERDKVERRAEQVSRLLADTRVTVAKNFEQNQQFAAAKNEFRLALLLIRNHPVALEGYERCTREAAAAELLRDAEMLIHKDEFEAARAVLAEGLATTEQQQDGFEAMAARLEVARFQALYELAVSLEADYQFEAAVKAYDRLIAEAQFYEDAISRRETLLDFIAHAENLYTQAIKATDRAERLALFEQIEVIWPEYRDLQERLATLRSDLGGQP